ncbi:MAG TPA: hypothetical protein VF339_08405 [Gammaproteobacteria bacterium]
MALTRTDKTAAAFAALFIGLIAVESVLFTRDATDADRVAAAEAFEHDAETAAGTSPRGDRTAMHADLAEVDVTRVAHRDGALENPFTASGACCGYAGSASARLQRPAAGKSDAALPQ